MLDAVVRHPDAAAISPAASGFSVNAGLEREVDSPAARLYFVDEVSTGRSMWRAAGTGAGN